MKKDNWQKSITPQLRDLELNEGEFFFFTINKIKNKQKNIKIENSTSLKMFSKLTKEGREKVMHFMQNLKVEVKSIKKIKDKMKIKASSEELFGMEQNKSFLKINDLRDEEIIKYHQYLFKALSVTNQYYKGYGEYLHHANKVKKNLYDESVKCKSYECIKKESERLNRYFNTIENSYEQRKKQNNIIGKQISEMVLKLKLLKKIIKERNLSL